MAFSRSRLNANISEQFIFNFITYLIHKKNFNPTPVGVRPILVYFCGLMINFIAHSNYMDFRGRFPQLNFFMQPYEGCSLFFCSPNK